MKIKVVLPQSKCHLAGETYIRKSGRYVFFDSVASKDFNEGAMWLANEILALRFASAPEGSNEVAGAVIDVDDVLKLFR